MARGVKGSQPLCRVPGCGKPSIARQRCRLHYLRWSRTGEEGPVEPKRRASFWERVAITGPDDCWLWDHPDPSTGYGVVTAARRRYTAHRWAYEQLVGPIPEGLQLDHLCRNRLCVNPAHLEPVTHVENTMRGESIAAQNARKTHCKRGHEFTPENTVWETNSNGRPARRCRACRRLKRSDVSGGDAVPSSRGTSPAGRGLEAREGVPGPTLFPSASTPGAPSRSSRSDGLELSPAPPPVEGEHPSASAADPS